METARNAEKKTLNTPLARRAMGDRAEPYASGLRFLGKPCQLLPSAPQEFCGLYENPYHPGWLSIFMIFYYDVILV